MRSSYRKEALENALADAGIAFTDEQFADAISSLDIWLENEGMATGRDCIPNPAKTEIAQLREAHKTEMSSIEKSYEQKLERAEFERMTLRIRISGLRDQLEARNA